MGECFREVHGEGCLSRHYGKSEHKLAQLVASHLEREKFLLVMDDIWSKNDWDKLQIALPKSNKMGKVLITSRHEDVAWFANRNRDPHRLRFLTQEESWLQLRLEVFGKPVCPPELQVLGKLIAKLCGGLPLAIVTVGGVLATEYFSSLDMRASRIAWRKACRSVNAYLNRTFYNNLPCHLQDCFLYFGMFPEDFEIPVWKLIRMWIAEGFIRQKDGLSLEQTAEKYLYDLINLNLVKIEKTKSDGRVKTCRIHDTLREFCITEAGNRRESFLQEINRSTDGVFEPLVSGVQKHHRLCIHSNVLNFISSKPYGPGVHSFVCFSREKIIMPTRTSSVLFEAFRKLKVLHVKPIEFTRIPTAMYQLIHLRYIALSFNLSILPAAFSKLWSMQTLIIDTTSRTLEIKADIWKLIQLSYFKTNASATLPKTDENSKESEKLQTLGTISPRSCTRKVFDRAQYLKKLSIRGQIALLLDGKNKYSFDNLGHLEKLKLLNDVYPCPPWEGQLPSLPPPCRFPPKLRSLTFSATYLDWSHMSILGLLENLEVLKLKDKAFMGKRWVAADGGFRRLQVLQIGCTNLEFWAASGQHFPRLRCLELRNCEELREIPIGLADIPSLQLLYLYSTQFAATSAKKIQEAKQKTQEEEQTIKVGVFKLSIFPKYE